MEIVEWRSHLLKMIKTPIFILIISVKVILAGSPNGIICDKPERLFDPSGNYLTTACAIFKGVPLKDAIKYCESNGMTLFDGHDPIKLRALDQMTSVRQFTSSFWTLSKPPKCYELQKLRVFGLKECNCSNLQLIMCEYK